MKEEILAELINSKEYISYVEVGVWKGDNLAYISDHCITLRKLYGFDSYTLDSYKNDKISAMSYLKQKELEEISAATIDRFKRFKFITLLPIPSLLSLLPFLYPSSFSPPSSHTASSLSPNPTPL